MKPTKDLRDHLKALANQPYDEAAAEQDLKRFKAELSEHPDWRDAGRHFMVDVFVGLVVAQGRTDDDDPWSIAERIFEDLGTSRRESLLRLLLALYIYGNPELVEDSLIVRGRLKAEGVGPFAK